MNLDSEKNYISKVERFQNVFEKIVPDYYTNGLLQLAAVWLSKEISFLSSKVELDQGENPHIKNALMTIINWTTGDYLLRWHLPLTHSVIIKEIESNPELQRFIFGKLPQISFALYSFSRGKNQEETSFMLDLLLNTYIFPAKNNIFKISFSPALLETATPDAKYLKEFFFENHWLLVLFFVLFSYQFTGFDQENI